MNDWMKWMLFLFNPLVDESEEREKWLLLKENSGGFSGQILNLKIVENNEDF